MFLNIYLCYNKSYNVNRVLDFQMIIQRTKIPYVIKSELCTSTIYRENKSMIHAFTKFNF